MAMNVYGNMVPAIVPEVLTSGNYATWSTCMKNYLLAHDVWDGIIESSCHSEAEVDGYKNWRQKNSAALHAIQITCSPTTFALIKEINSASRAWELLALLSEPRKCDPEPEADQTTPAAFSSATGIEKSERIHYAPLLNAIYEGDPYGVKEFFDTPENPRGVKLSDVCSTAGTALHVAVTAGHVRVVEMLVKMMSEEELEIRDVHGNTALSLAAYKGATKIAECLILKNRGLVYMPNRAGKIPLVVACERGYKEITYYLYSYTPRDFLSPESGNHGISLLVCCTMNEMFDIALDLLHRFPHLAATKDYPLVSTLLYLLSRLPSAFPSGSRLAFWQRVLYYWVNVEAPAFCCDVRIDIHPHYQHQNEEKARRTFFGRLRTWVLMLLQISGIKQICDLKSNHMHAIKILRCLCSQISASSSTGELDERVVYEVISEGMKHGITEFVVEIIKSFVPGLTWFNEEDLKDILISAIEYRQEEIFSLVHGRYPWKDTMDGFTDDQGNNLLHLVGKLAPDLQLSRINSAALQFQSELKWYKEVESIVPPMYKHALNLDGETPRQMFTRNHKELMKKGEEWMKQTAGSSTIVGTLIITIMFAAAFTVPGGNDQYTGFPIHLQKKAFLVFIIADAISLVAATTSVLMFVGILTSRFAEGDFLKLLPTKLVVCLSTLFMSIAAMMLAFCSALVITLRGRLSLVVPIIVLACIPVAFFVFLQSPILAGICISTYGRRSFIKKY